MNILPVLELSRAMWIATPVTPTVKSIPNQIVIFCLIGAELARDEAGRNLPDICGALIASKLGSHRFCVAIHLAGKHRIFHKSGGIPASW
ncbi:hypothetical protein AO242_27005 [Pseudomonas sp. ICMP 561]|nr:hypothetical protein AO242_27005 [Pseudomonas sp. ICMP 561]